MHDRRWLMIGAPIDGSGTGRGERRAPGVLRAHGLAERIGGTDLGDLGVEVADPRRDERTGITGFAGVLHGSRVVRDAVATALSAGWRPLVLGGCCSILPGVLAGVRRANGPASLVFVDGHLDLFDGQTSTTGELAGMDLAVVVGHGPPELTELAGTAPIVDPGDVIAVGDADGERRRRFGAPGPEEVAPALRVIDAAAVAGEGAEVVAERVAGLTGGPYWLHVDVDVLDESVMPAVSYPTRSGLTWEDLERLLAPIAGSPRLIGANVTDYNADRDPDGSLGRRLADLLVRVLGDAP
jgi:arginase